MLTGVWTVLLGYRVLCAGTEARMTKKGGSTGADKVVGCGVSKLGSMCWSCAGSHRWSCAYGEGWGRAMVSASSFVPRDVSPRMLSLWDALITSHVCVPQVLFRLSFVLPSLQEQP